MLPLNFKVNYVFLPLYLAASLLLLALFGVFMEIDDEKYLIHGLFCFFLFVMISIIFLAFVPYIRKKAIKFELERYDFDTSKEETLEIYDFSADDFSLKFDKYGMYADGELFYYNHLEKVVVTSNHLQRIGICLQFIKDEQYKIALSVNPGTLKMLESLEIKLDNQSILEYILSNKTDAFDQIYQKG